MLENADEARFPGAFWRGVLLRAVLGGPVNRMKPGDSAEGLGNWRARFKAEPQPSVGKLLYRRRGLSHTLVIALVRALVI